LNKQPPANQFFPLVSLYIIGFVGFISQSFLYPVMPLYASKLGASVADVGLIVSIYSYGTAIGMIPVGILSDRYGRRGFLVAGLIIYTLVPFLYPLASDPAELMAIRAVHGIGQALFIATVLAAVVDLAPAANRGIAIGWYTTATQSGLTAGPPLGGLIMNLISYEAAFWTSSIVSLVGLCFVLARYRTLPKTQENAPPITFSWGWLTNKFIWGALLTSFFIAIGVGTIGSYIPLYALSYGINEIGAGVILMATFLTSALFRAPAGKMSDKIGREPIILWGAAICIVSTALVSQVHSLVLLCIVGLLFGTGMGTTMSSSMALNADHSPPGIRGLAMSFYACSFQVGNAFGPTMMGMVAGASNMETMFLACSGAMILGMVAVFFLIRGKRQALRESS
jgi:DHA1 family multidrug resistance protein-like MFS transporter